MAAIVIAAYWSAHAQQETPGQPSERQTAGPAQGRGRGPAEPPQPTPRLADGTVNFGRVPGEKGIWNVPYITNMGMRVVDDAGNSLAPQPEGRGGRGAAAAGGGRAAGAPLGGGEGTGGGRGRGGAKTEPWVPFQPWAAAVYDYNSKNDSKYDPE